MANNFKFSSSQLQAITQKGTNILVSAGAGSGKTTVLTERISRQVQEGTPITRFLVLTFTEAAANEMKGRIRQEVSKTEGEEGALLVDESHIETFDAFALWLVKKYSYALGITSDISIIDKGIMKIKAKETIDQVIEEYLSNPEFYAFYTKYCYKNDEIIVKGIQSILDLAAKKLDKNEFYRTYVEQTYNLSHINSLINQIVKEAEEFIDEASVMIANIENEKEEENLLNLFQPFYSAKDFNSLRDLFINSVIHNQVRNISGKDSNVHHYLVDKFKEIKKYFLCGSSQDIVKEFMSHRNEAEIFVKMSEEVDRRLDDFKKKNGVYDFSDISFLANKLFRENKDIVNEVASMFDYIFIDEYQDTNDIQEFVISSLGRDNVYMVGDIKQSIYRFRNADCEIFNRKFNQYKQGIEGVEVDLNNNFRSRAQVVEGVNRIFGYLMDPEDNPITRIDYQQGHHFVPGEGQEEYAKHEDEPVEEYGFVFKEYPYDKQRNNSELEANLIADDIIHKVNTGFKIYDKKQNETRPCKYSDFAILCDTSTHFALVQKVFNSRNIPLVLKADESSLDIIFARIIKNIVKLIYFFKIGKFDDDFRHAYISISRSPVFKEDDQTIYDKLKERDPEILINNIKDDKLYMTVEEIAKQADTLSLSEIMLLIYSKFDLTNCIFKLGSYEKNSLLWDQFVSNSLEMEKLGFTLKEYVDYFDSLDNLEISLDVPSIQDVDNAVSLSTIHKAKGLEYHIVYLPFLEGNIYGKAISSIPQIYASPSNGLIFPKMDIGMEDSFSKIIAKNKEKEEVFNEKMRLLYVAMTRCMDETILVMSHESEKAKLPYFVNNSKKYTHVFRYLREKGVVEMRPVEATDEQVEIHEKDYKQDEINLMQFNYEYTQKPKHQASKELHMNNPELLQYGTNAHYLMEHIDYETKDTSFIKDKRLKTDIDQILSLPIFKDLKNDNILHEYEFYDEQNNVHGIIDCLIVRDDHIDIIDFKLKNIDDQSYHHQLNTYRKYIEKVSNLPIHMYLLSIFDKILEEVAYEDN